MDSPEINRRIKTELIVGVVVCAGLCGLFYYLDTPDKSSSTGQEGEVQQSVPAATPAQTADGSHDGSDRPDSAIWKYDIQTGDLLIQQKMIDGRITLTEYAKQLGFHIKKNEVGNWTAQRAAGIKDHFMRDYDIFDSPSKDCPNSDTVGVNLPESIILWNDDETKCAVLTYCVDSANGRVRYNNTASIKMTTIHE
jgi:hypothetical protein